MSFLFFSALFGLTFARPDIGLELRKSLQTSYGVPVESVTGLPPVIQSYLPPSPTYQTPLVSTAVPFYSVPTVNVAPTLAPIAIDQSYISSFSSQQQIQQQPSHVAVQKHVYFYEAPEDQEEIQPHSVPTAPPSKKNVKILFIKAPTYKVPPYVQPVYPQQQEKTLVYVLVKKPDEQEQIVVEPPPSTPPSKPEVFFIKYKNKAEAEEKVQDTLNAHAESGVNVITNNVETAPISGESFVPIVTTPSPILTNYVSTPIIHPGVSIVSNGVSGHFVSSTEAPIISSTYGLPIISSTESPVISSTYLPSIDINKVEDSYGPPPKPHGIYGSPTAK